MKIRYLRHGDSETERVIKPVGIMFSEFYFYLSAFADNMNNSVSFNGEDVFLSAYRVDRIQQFEVLDRNFDAPYKDRFDEREIRKRISFMCGCKLRRIKFLYKGKDVESVLDRFPASKIVGRTDEGIVIIAEVFGDGYDTWVRSQGKAVEVLHN